MCVVRTSVAGPQLSGEGFSALVEEAQERVEAESTLVIRRRVLFVGVRVDQRRVEVHERDTRISSASALDDRCHPGRACRGQSQSIGELSHEQRADSARHALALEGHCNAVRGATTVHL